MKPEKGQFWKIYQWPVTQEGYEGIAELVKRHPSRADHSDCEGWAVRFGSEEGVSFRLVNRNVKNFSPSLEGG